MAETLLGTMILSVVLSAFFLVMSSSLTWQGRLVAQMEAYQNAAFSRRSIVYAIWHASNTPTVLSAGKEVRTYRQRFYDIWCQDGTLQLRLSNGQRQRITITEVPSYGFDVETMAYSKIPVFAQDGPLIRCQWQTFLYQGVTGGAGHAYTLANPRRCYQTKMAVVPDTTYFSVGQSF